MLAKLPLELATNVFDEPLDVRLFDGGAFVLAGVKLPDVEFAKAGCEPLEGAKPGVVAGCAVTLMTAKLLTAAGGTKAFAFPVAVNDCRNELASTCDAAHSGAAFPASEPLGLGVRKLAIPVPICVMSCFDSYWRFYLVVVAGVLLAAVGPFGGAAGRSPSACCRFERAERMIELRGSPLLMLLKIS